MDWNHRRKRPPVTDIRHLEGAGVLAPLMSLRLDRMVMVPTAAASSPVTGWTLAPQLSLATRVSSCVLFSRISAFSKRRELSSSANITPTWNAVTIENYHQKHFCHYRHRCRRRPHHVFLASSLSYISVVIISCRHRDPNRELNNLWPTLAELVLSRRSLIMSSYAFPSALRGIILDLAKQTPAHGWNTNLHAYTFKHLPLYIYRQNNAHVPTYPHTECYRDKCKLSNPSHYPIIHCVDVTTHRNFWRLLWKLRSPSLHRYPPPRWCWRSSTAAPWRCPPWPAPGTCRVEAPWKNTRSEFCRWGRRWWRRSWSVGSEMRRWRWVLWPMNRCLS